MIERHGAGLYFWTTSGNGGSSLQFTSLAASSHDDVVLQSDSRAADQACTSAALTVVEALAFRSRPDETRGSRHHAGEDAGAPSPGCRPKTARLPIEEVAADGRHGPPRQNRASGENDEPSACAEIRLGALRLVGRDLAWRDYRSDCDPVGPGDRPGCRARAPETASRSPRTSRVRPSAMRRASPGHSVTGSWSDKPRA
jgi:hypothetical protein